MPRRGENIRKRIDGRWEGRYIEKYDINGKACYRSVYASSYSEIKTKLKDHQNSQLKTIQCSVTVEELCNEWLLNKKSMIKESTYMNYYTVIQNHIIPFYKNKKTRFITSESVDAFIKAKLLILSEKTVHDIITIFKQIIKYAVSKKYIGYFEFEITQPKIPTNDLTVLDNYEHNKLINYIQLTFDVNKTGILLSLFMGLRIGEICALKWKDIDFQNKILKISKTMQRIKNLDVNAVNKTKIIIDTPKSQKSVREIPIPSFMFVLLNEYKSNEDNYVLTGTPDFIEPRVYETMFKKYLKEAGMKDINFHALRHTFATRAVEQNFDIKSLSEILGHSSVKFTLERYVHPSKEYKRMNMEKMAAFY